MKTRAVLWSVAFAILINACSVPALAASGGDAPSSGTELSAAAAPQRGDSADAPKTEDEASLRISDFEPYGDQGSYTQTFSVYLEGLSADCPLILSCDAQYLSEGENIPTIQMFLNNQDDKTLYYSPAYQIGARDGFALKEWRVPPAQAQYNRLKITVYIPEGVTLRIRAVSMRAEENTRQTDEAIRYHAHQGFSGLCAQSTAYAFEMAGRMGYRSCITIPKFTSDGVCVCFHDDDTIRRKLRYDDGGQITAGSADDRPVSELSFAELMRFDAGLRKNEIYAGERVPTIDEFFEICARYHMAPVLSVHSSPEFYGEAGLAHFAAIRESAERYGVLQDLRIKSGNYRVQSAARSVFDKDIAGYILIQGQNSTWDPLLVARNSGFVSEDAESMAESEYWVVMEFFYAAATEEKLTRAKSEGFPLSIATTGAGISGPEQERLMGLGVTEFTIDHHCSMGLSW